jgi:CubicO group peptidase (beta-lactamase class C family)
MVSADIIVEGYAHPRFEGIKQLFRDNLASSRDLGASFAATVDGETVIDIWGGWADHDRTNPWEADTIVNVYSTTKTMTALAALLLADRRALDLDAPVCHYWPEFSAEGKSGITTKHLLSHSSGLSGWREPMVPADMYDWEKATALLAAQAPFWKPGTAPGYHALTQGFLIGEVVRRITGQSLGTFFRQEIAEPLGSDFHIGMRPEHDHRVADLIPPPATLPFDAGIISELTINMMTNPISSPLETRTRAWRAAEIPAANGHGNARSITEIHALLANGGIAKGKRLLSEAGCRRALEAQVEGTDAVLGIPARYGLGFGLSPMIPLPGPDSIFWGGYGGSLAVIDLERRTSCAFAMNRMGMTTVGDARGLSMAQEFWTLV